MIRSFTRGKYITKYKLKSEFHKLSIQENNENLVLYPCCMLAQICSIELIVEEEDALKQQFYLQI